MFRESQWPSGRKLTANGGVISSNPDVVPFVSLIIIKYCIQFRYVSTIEPLILCERGGLYHIRKGTEPSFHFSNCTVLRINCRVKESQLRLFVNHCHLQT